MGKDKGVRVKVWGTWEELVLGGAVLRHGTGDWDVVASELRSRTLCPYYFTPEACKGKYEDLQRRYMGCKSWYEELRKCRVAELKRELEKSEESIGFLVAKLESLKAAKEHWNQIDYDSSQTESPKTKSKVKIKTFLKDISKDEFELSASSFTQDNGSNPRPKTIKVKQESAKGEMGNEKGGTFRKRRGKRKRKDGNWKVNERSEHVGPTSIVRCNDTSTSGGDQTVCSSSVDLQDGDMCSDDMVGIFNSITENQYALVFRRRLDSQKRARYRKTVRQHMDLDTIRSRIANCSIKSAKELFRDFLLLANNALVFYSKRTREYKSALTFRVNVTKKYKQLCTDTSSISNNTNSNKTTLSSILCFPSMFSRPVRPRSVRPRPPCKKPKLMVKLPNGGSAWGPHEYLKPNGDIEKVNGNMSNICLVKTKNDKENELESKVDPKPFMAGKGLGRARKGGGGGGRGNRQQNRTPLRKDGKKPCKK